MLRKCELTGMSRDVKGLNAVDGARVGLRPSPPQVLCNQDVAEPGGGVEGLPANVARSAGLRTSPFAPA